VSLSLRPRRPRGFTLVELLAAIVVIGVAVGMLVALMVSARRATRAGEERRLAAAAAQGTLERLRGARPDRLPGSGGAPQAVPPEARRLREVGISAAARPWKGDRGMKHVTVRVTWRSRTGGKRESVREALVSDARER
jgi:prepilin-type N-terminal cleavage/methylation domain-containing protein